MAADEYRKTIGKDAALERRFQPVTVDEPTVASTIAILRGLKPRYEVHHGVEISDAALVTGMSIWFCGSLSPPYLIFATAAVYSARYISDRYLPDKAIDLVDEAASALRLAQESKPDELEALERQIVTLQIEYESLKKETDVFSVERRQKVEEELMVKRQEADKLTSVWQAGRPSHSCTTHSCPCSHRYRQSVHDSSRSRRQRRSWRMPSTNLRLHNVKGSTSSPPGSASPPFQN